MPSRTRSAEALGRSIPARRGPGDPVLAKAAAENLARRQWGVVGRAQLRAAGWSDARIDRWATAGSLVRLHPGVFALGHAALRPEGWWTGALLAAGPPAVLSHFTAAELWGLDAPRRAEVHVTTTRRSGRMPPSFTLHRVRGLAADEVAVRRGFGCTTVIRTIVDLADMLALRDVARLIESAEVAGALDAGALLR